MIAEGSCSAVKWLILLLTFFEPAIPVGEGGLALALWRVWMGSYLILSIHVHSHGHNLNEPLSALLVCF